MISKLVSGGQTGADRAALDVALKHALPHGGWCPKGRKAEDGPISSGYLLAESSSGNYLQRTEWNARDTDGTVIFTMKPAVSGGSKRTVEFAQKHVKPWLHLYPQMEREPSEVLLEFVEKHQIQTLNVAGSRGSKEPELHAWVCEVLEATFFATDAQRVVAPALQHLGPEIEVTQVKANADCPVDYGKPNTADCWRVYFRMRLNSETHVGGDSPYILIEKETHRVIGRGIERGE
jgi:hypothetical protein